MPSEQDNTALAAIIIAIIAFLVTTGQLLQQVFGTAVGYRHCQASVIGDWAIWTRRKWRWSEFRFETKFTTPNIRLVEVADGTSLGTVRLITGDVVSRIETYCLQISNPDDDEGGDLVGWLALLDELHVHQSRYPRKGLYTDGGIDWHMKRIYCPAITLRERSWDFMPPDIIRPVATSTVGDIIALGHRLRLGWEDLRPGDGVMRAEGAGISIVSTAVRGFGMLLQFNYDRAGREQYTGAVEICGTIPSVSADKLGFGIIDGAELHMRDIVFEGANETEAAKEVMHGLEIDRAVINKYGKYMEQSGNSLGFSDILGMSAPFMPFQGSSITRVMKVHRDVDRGPTCSREGFVVFQLRLEKYEKEGACSEQMLYLLSSYRRLKEKWQSQWEIPMHGAEHVRAPREFLSEIHKLWRDVMNPVGERYKDDAYLLFSVLASHISQAVEYPELAKAALNDPSSA